MRDMKNIAKIVQDVLAIDFENIKVLKVQVRDDVDADGEEVLRVDVFFEGSPKDLQGRSLAGAVRRVRPKLIEAEERAFPVFSFISNKEISAGAFEAA
jgi:hypothetical protein